MESRALTKVLGIPIERTVNGARSEMRLITGDEVPASAVVPVSTLVQAVAPVLEPEPDPEPEFSQSPEPVPLEEAEVELVEQAAPLPNPAPPAPPLVEEGSSWPEPLSSPVFADVPDVRFEPEDVVAIEEEPTLAAEAEEPDAPSLDSAPLEVVPTVPTPKSKASTASAKKGQAVQADLFDF